VFFIRSVSDNFFAVFTASSWKSNQRKALFLTSTFHILFIMTVSFTYI
jgi:hypothetical protein